MILNKKRCLQSALVITVGLVIAALIPPAALYAYSTFSPIQAHLSSYTFVRPSNILPENFSPTDSTPLVPNYLLPGYENFLRFHKEGSCVPFILTIRNSDGEDGLDKPYNGKTFDLVYRYEKGDGILDLEAMDVSKQFPTEVTKLTHISGTETSIASTTELPFYRLNNDPSESVSIDGPFAKDSGNQALGANNLLRHYKIHIPYIRPGDTYLAFCARLSTGAHLNKDEKLQVGIPQLKQWFQIPRQYILE